MLVRYAEYVHHKYIAFYLHTYYQQRDMKTTEQNREHESKGGEKHILWADIICLMVR